MPLGRAVIRAAVYAATEDPRFPRVGPDELAGLVETAPEAYFRPAYYGASGWVFHQNTDLWRAAKARHGDPVAAWAAIVEDPLQRKSYQQARGKGGFRRSSWEEVEEIIAASTIYTIKKYGADRLVGFSPIPAMSMLSFAGGVIGLTLVEVDNR